MDSLTEGKRLQTPQIFLLREPFGVRSTYGLPKLPSRRGQRMAMAAPAKTIDNPGRIWNRSMCEGSYMQAICI
jgi:hypothetical protein